MAAETPATQEAQIVPLGTRNEVRGDGYVTKQNEGSRGPTLGRVEARVEDAKPCD